MTKKFMVLVLAMLGALASPSFASEDLESIEILVGWSADGERYAVVKSWRLGGGALLEVHDRDKIVATFKEGDKGVPEPAGGKHGVERIDIETWAPLRTYGLAKITAASRKRFADAYVLAATGTRRADRCKEGGWTIATKIGAKVVFSDRRDGHCFAVHGGYLHADGKRALVKLTEDWYTPRGSSEKETKLVLVELP